VDVSPAASLKPRPIAVKPPASGSEPAQLSLAVIVPVSPVERAIVSCEVSAFVAVDVTVVVCVDASVLDLAVSVERLHPDSASKNKITIWDESSHRLAGLPRT
jgi:hypothetical protein